MSRVWTLRATGRQARQKPCLGSLEYETKRILLNCSDKNIRAAERWKDGVPEMARVS